MEPIHTKKNSTSKTRNREWIFPLGMALVLVLLTAAPFLYGHVTRPAGTVFTGLHHLAPGDTNVFLSMIEQVRQGENVFINLYTHEEQAQAFINPLWLSVGWLTKIDGISNLLALHIARSIWIVIFVFVLYRFLSYFITNARARRWALAMLLFASGLGVFFNPFLFDVNNIYEHPTDIWIAESVNFLSALHSPHLLASLTLLVLTLYCMLRAFDTNRWRYSIGAAVSSFFLVWFHPFNGPTVFVVLLVYMLVRFVHTKRIHWKWIQHYVVLGMGTLPPVLYLWLLAQRDWVIRNWSAQNILPSPSLWMYMIGFGLLLPLALVGIWRIIKDQQSSRVFLVVWILVTLVLMYVPVSFQRRMSEGVQIPLVLLAFFGVWWCWSRLRQRGGIWATAGVMGLIIFLPLSNLQVLGQDFFLFTTKHDLPYYLMQDEVDAMHWLRDHTDYTDVIFSSYYMGNYIPAYSGRVVWIGHGPQTIDLQYKFEDSEAFWSDDADPPEKEQLLRDGRVTYVWYGRKEKELGSFDPSTKPYLREAHRTPHVVIYSVTPRQSE